MKSKEIGCGKPLTEMSYDKKFKCWKITNNTAIVCSKHYGYCKTCQTRINERLATLKEVLNALKKMNCNCIPDDDCEAIPCDLCNYIDTIEAKIKEAEKK